MNDELECHNLMMRVYVRWRLESGISAYMAQNIYILNRLAEQDAVWFDQYIAL